MNEYLHAFLEYAQKEYGLSFPADVNYEHAERTRVAMPEDKGSEKSGFVTAFYDEYPCFVFGDWRKYGEERFTYSVRDPQEFSKAEKEEFKRLMKERQQKHRQKVDLERKSAAVLAGEIWSMPDLGVIDYQYLNNKKCGAYGVKFFDRAEVGYHFLSKEKQADVDAGKFSLFSGPVMVVPVQNCAGQLVSLQQVSADGKFKGFLSNGLKEGCFHVIPGDDTIIFIAEGYATAATIHELTGCTTYVAFDSGNLLKVASVVASRHPDAVKIVASDNDRFTVKPVKNPGQTKAIEVCKKLGFYNLRPDFHESQNGTDWNDLLQYYSFETVKSYCMKKLQAIFDKYEID